MAGKPPRAALTKSFASDNNSGIHPRVLAALLRANAGHALAYGADPWTRAAKERFRRHFGKNSEAHFVFNGTAANVLGLRAGLESHEAVICAEGAHLNVDECGAPEKFLGCKLLACPAENGKLTVEAALGRLRGVGDQHSVQPRAISITQATELGTVYSPGEIRRLADFAHRRGLLLHMDGARLANAAASLGLPLRKLTADSGVDILTFGGTKNGALAAEAVVLFGRKAERRFKFIRKQGMQLASKMRFLAAQLDALLAGDLWLKNARQANRMARLLAQKAAQVPGVRIAREVEANAVFAFLPKRAVPILQRRHFFYVWDPTTTEVRWMCSYDTTEDDVREFVRSLKAAVRSAA